MGDTYINTIYDLQQQITRKLSHAEIEETSHEVDVFEIFGNRYNLKTIYFYSDLRPISNNE